MNRLLLSYVVAVVILAGTLLPTVPKAYSVSTTGLQKVIIILVEFPDKRHSVSLFDLRRMADALVDYYEDQSYGKLLLQVDIDQEWHMASHQFYYYHRGGTYSNPTFDTERKLAGEAIALADNEVDFSKYGFVMVFHAGAYKGSWAFTNPLGWGEGECWTYLDKSCQDKVTVDNENDWTTAFHEFGHLLGLPDLYDKALLTQGKDACVYVGDWDIMGSCWEEESSAVGFSAWSRIQLGWISKNEVVSFSAGENGSVTLAPLELGNGTLAIEIPLDSGGYYIVEHREGIGYDGNLPGVGVLVYLAQDWLGGGQGPLRLVRMQPLSGKFSENNVTIAVLKLTYSAAQISVTTRMGGPQRTALESINQANASIQKAMAEGRTEGLNGAIQLFTWARDAYSTRNYSYASSLAKQAQVLADSARIPVVVISTNSSSSSTKTSNNRPPVIMSPLDYSLAAVIVASVSIVFLVAMKRRKEKTSH